MAGQPIDRLKSLFFGGDAANREGFNPILAAITVVAAIAAPLVITPELNLGSPKIEVLVGIVIGLFVCTVGLVFFAPKEDDHWSKLGAALATGVILALAAFVVNEALTDALDSNERERLETETKLAINRHEQWVFRSQDLSGFDLSGLKLELPTGPFDLAYADLSDACLQNVEMRGVVLHDADLTGADLSGAAVGGQANLDRVTLTDAAVGNADFTDASMLGANLEGLKQVELDVCPDDEEDGNDDAPDDESSPTQVAGLAGLRSVTTSQEDEPGETSASGDESAAAAEPVVRDEGLHSHLRLNGADLTAAILTDADLSGADLTNADLTGATLLRTNLKGADLNGAMVTELQLAAAHTDAETTCPNNTKDEAEDGCKSRTTESGLIAEPTDLIVAVGEQSGAVLGRVTVVSSAGSDDPSIEYSLPDAEDLPFAINSSGDVLVAGVVDPESAPYVFDYMVTRDADETLEDVGTITVRVNRAPEFGSAEYVFSVGLPADPGRTAGAVSALDPDRTDPESSGVQYFLESTERVPFDVDAATGEVYVTEELTRRTAYSFAIVATDLQARAGTARTDVVVLAGDVFRVENEDALAELEYDLGAILEANPHLDGPIELGDVLLLPSANAAPVFKSKRYDFRSPDRAGEDVGTVEATDENGDEISYRISDPDDSGFRIDPASGVITLEDPDRAGTDPVKLEITASAGGHEVTTSVMITDEEPDFAPPVFVPDHHTPEIVVDGFTAEPQTYLVAADNPGGQAITYAIVGADDGLVTINARTGQLLFHGRLRPIPVFEVIASDDAGEILAVAVVAPRVMYEVQADDRLAEIALRFYDDSQRFTEIQQRNGLTTDVIQPGVRLEIPVLPED